MFRSILVPLDGSGAAEAALEAAIYLARAAHGEIKLVRAQASRELSSLEQDTDEEADCREYLLHVVRRLHAEGLQARSEVLDGGPVAERILEVLEDEDFDLVVLTSHGRTGISRFLLGSVAEKLARHSSVPVLIVGRRIRTAVPVKADSDETRA